MAELEDVFAIVLVHGLAERPPERNAIVADDRRVVRQNAARVDAPARRRK
jgi:hypothetical protein